MKDQEAQKKIGDVPEKKTGIPSPQELYQLNPLTFDKSTISNKQIVQTSLDNDRSRPDCIYYYLHLVDMASKIEVQVHKVDYLLEVKAP